VARSKKKTQDAPPVPASVPLEDGLTGIVGHTRVLEVLRRSLDSGKLHHAYLFSGPGGVGKRTTARGLAQALNCETKPGTGCGRCNTCTRIERLLHPDYMEIGPDGKWIKVGQIRELEGRLETGPFEGRAVVAVLSPADWMNLAAANALLKVLEEPRPAVHFVLAAAAPLRLPATVRSRCQVLRFGPLSTGQVVSFLTRRAGLSEAVAGLAARLSEGSLGRALRLASASDLGDQRQMVNRICGLAGTRAAPDTVFHLAGELADAGAALDGVLELLRVYLRDLLWVCSGVEASGDRLVNMDQLDALKQRARGLHPGVVLTWDHSVRRAQAGLRAYANKRLAMEEMLLELTER
jgi:DNA polymerase-3 subunit delta'